LEFGQKINVNSFICNRWPTFFDCRNLLTITLSLDKGSLWRLFNSCVLLCYVFSSLNHIMLGFQSVVLSFALSLNSIYVYFILTLQNKINKILSKQCLEFSCRDVKFENATGFSNHMLKTRVATQPILG
jgi:hypothetical protein